jgi:hypothetical protein
LTGSRLSTNEINSSIELIETSNFDELMAYQTEIFTRSHVLTASEYLSLVVGYEQEMGSSGETEKIVGIGLASVIVLFLIGILLFLIVKRHRKYGKTESDFENETSMKFIVLDGSDSDDQAEDWDIEQLESAIASAFEDGSSFARAKMHSNEMNPGTSWGRAFFDSDHDEMF